MTDTPPVKKDEEKNWKVMFDEEIAPMITDYGGVSNDPEIESAIKSFISRLLLKEHTLLNEKMAKVAQDAYHVGFQAALKQIGEATKVRFLNPDKMMKQMLDDAFNRGYETAIDERKGKV